MAESRSKEEVIAECEKLMRWTREELDNEGCVLYQLFLDYDDSLDGRIDEEEIEHMLKEFDPTADEDRLHEYKKMLTPEATEGPHERGALTFVDFCMWWHNVKNNPGEAADGSPARARAASPRSGGVTGRSGTVATEGLPEAQKPGAYLSAMLQARYMAQLTGRMTFGMLADDKTKTRMKDASMEVLNEFIAVNKQTLYALKSWNSQLRKEKLWEEENALREKGIAEYKEKGEPFSQVDKRNLLFLFDSLASSKGRIRITSDLPQLCAILKWDIPLSVLETTQKVYNQDHLTFDQFLLWWAARPEAGGTRWTALLG